MIIHGIHDLSDEKVLNLLKNGFSKITDTTIVKNYHPDYSNDFGNFFYVLKEGRYRQEFGRYYVIEEEDSYIASAGWNTYPHEEKTAIVLSRMYIDKKHRGSYIVGKHILPLTFKESIVNHNRLWMTFNQHNQRIKTWFATVYDSNRVPELYKKFFYVGRKEIYHTDQFVYEYTKS